MIDNYSLVLYSLFRFMALFLPVMKHVKFPTDKSERRQLYGLVDHPGVRSYLLGYMLDILLMPYRCSIYYSDYTVYTTQTIQYILLRLHSIYYSDYTVYTTQTIQYILLRLDSIYYSDYTVYITQTTQYILLRLYSIYYSDYTVYITQTIQYILLRLYSIYYSGYTVYITQTIQYNIYVLVYFLFLQM